MCAFLILPIYCPFIETQLPGLIFTFTSLYALVPCVPKTWAFSTLMVPAGTFKTTADLSIFFHARRAR